MDSEYRKPYEYEEEKRGLIQIFIAMILVVDILQTLSFAAQENKYLGNITLIKIIIDVQAVLFILYIIYTSVVVYRMKEKFVSAAKRYLIIRTIFSLGNLFIVFYNILKHEKLIGKGLDQYGTTGNMLLWELGLPLFYIISFSLGWYLYFTFSKRCRGKK